jgi:trans-2,3-dihydro-3-hydroxyanthranilate isomerase
MKRRYVTADVFTDRMFGGNPVAVVLDAAGLSAAQMQAIACEFNYSETTFVLPPRDPSHTAWVRIFNPSREMPFAGHPNVGTAFVLARQMAARGEAVPDRLVFDEIAGLVPVDLLREGGAVVGAELTAPEVLSRRARVTPEQAAACLSLTAEDVRADAHPPQVVSVGLPFLVVELASRDALRRAKPDPVAYDSLLPLDGAFSVYAYTRDVGTGAAEAGTDLQARMFTRRMTEDAATGSATVAVTALLTEVQGKAELRLRVGQGVDMGRPSLLLARASRRDGGVTAFVGGRCITVMEGGFLLAGDEGDLPS